MKFFDSRLLTLLFLLILATSCQRTREEVVQTYPDGSPMLVYLLQGSKESPLRVGEKMFYQDGQLQFEKHFAGEDEHPDGTWNFYFDNGQVFATGDFTQRHDYGLHWQFFNRNGGAYYDAPFDSAYVSDFGMYGTPSTVVFCSGRNQDVIQFYSNYTVRSTERLVNGQRHGHVYFYYPNGNLQVEANFAEGLKEGPYIVYQEKGIPLYQGVYTHDVRTGIWEFYDEDGNLAKTQDFGK